MRGPFLIALALTSSCAREPPRPAPSLTSASASASALASASTSALASAPTAWPASLPKPALPPRAPIQARGFPTAIRTCLPDPAAHAGFTRDGAELGYCMQGMSMHCEFVDREGHTRTMTSEKDPKDGPATDPAKERALRTFMIDVALPPLDKRDCTLTPKPLSGTWDYGDITIDVAHVDASFKAGDGGIEDRLLSQPLVRIGGALAGEAPVHPLTYSAPHRKVPSGGEIAFNSTSLNAFALSPDGTELGVVIHANCMEWCDEFQVVRMPTSRFASLVYNDLGFRAYQKGDLERAIELFAKAAFVDAARELPAYNLACAYARKSDAPHAEAALVLAIVRGGDAVRARAAKDKDFDGVRNAAWFVNAVGNGSAKAGKP